MVEVGSEWFHRKSLAAMRVITAGSELEGIVNVAPEGELGDGRQVCMMRDEENFLRDYALNVPVTLELLERMGWRVRPVDSVIDRRFASMDIPEQDADVTVWCNADGSVDYAGVYREGPGVQLANVATLRGLLVTLRVFGVEAKVPE